MGNQFKCHNFLQMLNGTTLLPYETENLQGYWISDALGDKIQIPKEQTHSSPQPVLISAPTGCGKTHYVCQNLVKQVQAFGGYILILTNRSALALQEKYSLVNVPGGWIPSSANLTALSVFEGAIVLNYQGVLSQIAELKKYPIRAIVFDEIHFLCTDAMFNTRTQMIYQQLLQHFFYTKRIYLSATPEDVRPIIAYEERLVLDARMRQQGGVTQISQARQSYSSIKEYTLKRARSIKLELFDEWAQLEKEILADGSNDKWVVFTSNKEEGKQLKKRLNRGRKIAEYFDASYKEQHSQAFRDLARTERFQSKVLVSTSVLDNGVNFHDDLLKHVVVDSRDKVQIIQMVGRKRLKDGEKITVHIRNTTEKEVRSAITVLEAKQRLLTDLAAYPEYAFMQRWGTLSESDQHLIGVYLNNSQAAQGITFFTNGYAQMQIDCQLRRLERLKDRFALEGECAFSNEIREWFPQAAFNVPNNGYSNRTAVSLSLTQYLEQRENKPVSKAEAQTMEQDMVRMLSYLDIPERTKLIRAGESRTVANMNRMINVLGLPFQVKLRDNQVWILRKTAKNENG